MIQDFLKIYQKLPDGIKKSISAPERMKQLNSIEKEHGIKLAAYVIRVLIRDVNLNELPEVLVNEKGIELDKAQKISQELFGQVYGDIYDELQELYEEKRNKEIKAEGMGELVSVADGAQALTRAYQAFTKTSLFQNILAAEEGVRERINPPSPPFVRGGGQNGSKQPVSPPTRFACEARRERGEELGANQNNHPLTPSLKRRGEEEEKERGDGEESGEGGRREEVQNEFYTAINAGDKVKTGGILRFLAGAGQLRQFFQNDKRYTDFFAGVIERHQGEKMKEDFLKDPAGKKHLAAFLRFILEKRLGFNEQDSAMLGVGLGGLCRESGEREYEDMAYGDESTQKFSWI